VRSRDAKLLVALSVALLVLWTAAHTDEPWRTGPGSQVTSHQHGPSGQCPNFKDHDCLACHASGLLCPLRVIACIQPPPARRAAWNRTKNVESRFAAPFRGGRSPPLLQGI
jgi:hypothetical protein